MTAAGGAIGFTRLCYRTANWIGTTSSVGPESGRAGIGTARAISAKASSSSKAAPLLV